ncbi:MAG: hemolysin III family protein [Candidatus Synoicihabitans palmerolidicus]|nr:hemolysin III family protein [Candidatus Synoicihabitans palmerolidicus]
MTATSASSAVVYSRDEEIANSMTHGLGWLLSTVGLVVGVVLAVRISDPWVITSVAIYGTTLVLLYAASTLYHAIPSRRWKPRLRKLDQASIFLLIAGTYTPFVLVNLRGPWGWSLLGVVWGIALAGVVFKLCFTGRFVVLSSAICVALGWLIVIAAKPMVQSVPTSGLILLASGGLFDTGGVAFYLWRKLPYHHAIWHGFVMVGSACHYFAVLQSVR